VGSRWKNREEVTRRRARPTAASRYAGEGATSSAVGIATPLLRHFPNERLRTFFFHVTPSAFELRLRRSD